MQVLNNKLNLLSIQFSEKYGNIFSLQFFGHTVVIINGYKSVKEALVQRGEDFADRPIIPLVDDVFGNKGDFISFNYTLNIGVSDGHQVRFISFISDDGDQHA